MDKDDKDLHVDDEFKQSFNDGYTLAKELGMNTNSLKDISAGNQRMIAMRKGMEEFQKEIVMKKEKDKILKDMGLRDKYLSTKPPQKDKDKGLDLEI
ncbi:MAG: hypothetical protein ABJF04_09405 [Reichenbachiella sp.]|uniref:hypothetical protein n=1 Tax=Reichenbachiella sp. TaxID=2184521 RepID=UPI003266E2AB